MNRLPRTVAEAREAEAHDIPLRFLYFWGYTSPITRTHGANAGLGAEILSQFYSAPFVVGDQRFLTAEHWMMWSKARLFGDHEVAGRVLRSEQPSAAKQLGRQVRGFRQEVWNAHRFEIVVAGNQHKFRQHKPLAGYLESTAGRVLVEASPHDPVWGIGLRSTHPDAAYPSRWPGQNLLGFALGQVRDTL